MKLREDQSGRKGLPMPLWLQGALESAIVIVITAVLALAVLTGAWAAGSLGSVSFPVPAQLAGQGWLLAHGVPLTIHLYPEPGSSRDIGGLLSLVPWGLVIIPFFLAWRAGRRLARASYTDQLWQAVLGALGIYALFSLITAFICRTQAVDINLVSAALIPLIPVGLGLALGARRESGAWTRLIGVEAVDWISRTSQHSRWAGSYVWTVVRAGFVALLATLSLASAALVLTLAVHWSQIISVYQGLGTDPVGAAALTIAQAGYLPHLVVYSLAWLSGAGFTLGTGSTVSALGTAVGPVPPIPVLAAIPADGGPFALVALIFPVLAGVLAGWWFLREGENHFDEWLSIKVRQRWISAPVATLVLALAIGAVVFIGAAFLGWVTQGSLGLGRFQEVGPSPLRLGLMVAAEAAIGVAIGHSVGPWLERGEFRAIENLGRPAANVISSEKTAAPAVISATRSTTPDGSPDSSVSPGDPAAPKNPVASAPTRPRGTGVPRPPRTVPPRRPSRENGKDGKGNQAL